jgi:hypothetical protein
MSNFSLPVSIKAKLMEFFRYLFVVITCRKLKKKCDVGMTYNYITFIKAFHKNPSCLPTHESRNIDIFGNGHR